MLVVFSHMASPRSDDISRSVRDVMQFNQVPNEFVSEPIIEEQVIEVLVPVYEKEIVEVPQVRVFSIHAYIRLFADSICG